MVKFYQKLNFCSSDFYLNKQIESENNESKDIDFKKLNFREQLNSVNSKFFKIFLNF